VPFVVQPAFADGGAGGGGANGTQGAGAAGGTTNTGVDGGGTALGAGGGGGGGANGAGGRGGLSTATGSGTRGSGGSGSTSGNGIAGGNGGNATASGASGGGGGGGGGGGYGLRASQISNAATRQGGAGGKGGNGGNGGNATNGNGGGGGGGGVGGYGAWSTVTGSSSNSGSVTGGVGGNGGAGGTGYSDGQAGNGGDGGVGFRIAGQSTFTNSGTVTGGAGGTGRIAGAGGFGVAGVGTGLTILNTGTISGGLSGDGTTRADALYFTSVTNSLTLSQSGTTGTLNGGIGIGDSGVLSIDPGTAAGVSVTLANVIHDILGTPGSVTKIGAGTLNLSGANTYTGATNVSNGILQAGAANVFGSSSAVTVNSSTLDLNNFNQSIGSLAGDVGGTITLGTATLTLGSDNTTKIHDGLITGTGGVTKVGTGIQYLTGQNTFTGTTRVEAGTLVISSTRALRSTNVEIASGELRLNLANALLANPTVTQTGGQFAISGSQSIGSLSGSGGTGILLSSGTVLTVGSNNTSTTYGGSIGNNGNGALSKTGTGTLTLTGASSYTGATTIDSGTLQAGVANAISSSTGVIINNSGVFDLNSFAQSVGSLTGGTVTTVTLGSATLTIGSDNSNTVFQGVISGTGGVTKAGTGTQYIYGANTYTGTTRVEGGSLYVTSGGSLASTSYEIAGGELRLNQVNNVPASAAVTQTGGQLVIAASQQMGSLSGSGGNGIQFSAGTVLTVGSDNASTTYGGNLGGNGSAGALVKTGTGTLTLTGTSTYNDGTTLAGGAISIAAAAHLGTGVLTFDTGTLATTASGIDFTQGVKLNSGGGTVQVGTGLSDTISGVISDGNGAGSLSKTGAGILRLSGVNTYTGATTINAGALILSSGAGIAAGVTNNATFTTAGTVSGGVTNAGTVNAAGGALDGAIANNAGYFNVSGTLTSNSTFGNASSAELNVNSGTYTVGGLVSNSGTVTVANGGTLVATAGGISNVAGGSITVAAGGTLRDDLDNAGTVSNNGAMVATVASNTGSITNNAAWTGNVLSNAGAIVNAAGATWTGNVSNTGGTFANAGAIAGTLSSTAGTITNSGSISGGVTVSGGTFSGAGSVGTLSVNNGSSYAPGNGTAGSSATITSNLAFQSGASYLVTLNPATSSFADVAGTATLNGATVAATFANGSYVSQTYTIVNAAGGVIGTFGGVTTTNLPANFTPSLTYDAGHAYLKLALNFTPTPTPAPTPTPTPTPNPTPAPTPTPLPINSGLNDNQTRVANALVNTFTSTGGIPLAFGALNAAGLTQASGETATGAQQATFDAMTQFMGMLTDPAMAGRNAGMAGGGVSSFSDQALAYAGVRRGGRDAFAMITKAAPRAPAFESHWSVWAAGFGGSRSTDGNAVAGSGNATANIGGVAVGADYLLSPSTIAGFALAGGATSFTVANAGSGRSDLFQAGAYVRHNVGSAYLTAAAAYGWQEITTDRAVASSGLRARFNANAWSARIEGGNRYVLPWMNGIGLTPYAAAQVTALDLPSYAETINGGVSTFALKYTGKTVTSLRTEFGLRSDKSFAVDDAVLTLRGRAAWAHDFNIDRSTAATFQTLPGAAFTVNGAATARDTALTTASAEMRFVSGISLAATLEGEFSGNTRSYAGKGVLRYNW